MTRTLTHSLRPASGRRSRWLGWALAGAVWLLLALALAYGVSRLLHSGPQRGSASERAAEAAARSFLSRYVAPDGRVVRWDQGGDTVSEGQSYALLLSQVAGDPGLFERVWSWTSGHLRRPDGLLAYLADSDKIRDPTPASDADLVTAWALARTRGPQATAYHDAGRRIAEAVLRLETTSRGGRTILTAGPWATGSPASINPSYWALPALAGLARESDDPSWRALESSSLELAGALTSAGATLPPDWARIDGTRPTATPAPDGHVSYVQYGLDAQRLVVWLAASCDRSARRMAAAWWPSLSRPDRAAAAALDPSGAVRDGSASPMPLVAAAAAAGAAGDVSSRDRLLDRATRLDAARPSYYGAAWVALGRALLTTRTLGTCPSAGGAR
jgi:endoglucanase